MKEFDDKTILITGAASGVGKSTAFSFLDKGANVIFSDISIEYLEDIETHIEKNKHKVLIKEADIADSKQVDDLIGEAVDRFSTIDFLVNNAGVSMTKKMMELEKSDWDKVLDVNVKGAFDVLKKVAKQMIDNRIKGSIVNVASIAGEKGRPNFLAYSASKAAVISMTKSAALEFADHDIRLNAVSPGTIDTPMWEKIADDILKIQGGSKKDLLSTWIDKIPLKRLAKPEDIADVIVFLCSDKARFITGQTINICGGLSLV